MIGYLREYFRKWKTFDVPFFCLRHPANWQVNVKPEEDLGAYLGNFLGREFAEAWQREGKKRGRKLFALYLAERREEEFLSISIAVSRRSAGQVEQPLRKQVENEIARHKGLYAEYRVCSRGEVVVDKIKGYGYEARYEINEEDRRILYSISLRKGNNDLNIRYHVSGKHPDRLYAQRKPLFQELLKSLRVKEAEHSGSSMIRPVSGVC